MRSVLPESPGAPPAGQHTTGLLPCQSIRELVRNGDILGAEPIAEAQIQPASLDLRLGPVAYRVRASFLPGAGATVREKIDALAMHEVDLSRGAVLERGCVYVVPLIESLRLRKRHFGIANPKSSTGRLDVFTRLITDYAVEFERVREGYSGPLYAEISPRTFSVLLRTGARLNQLRIRRGRPAPTDAEMRRLNREVRLVHSEEGEEDISGGVALRVDLGGGGPAGLVGYRARRTAGLIDIDKVGHYDPLEFWEPVHVRGDRGIVLDPGDFYILASKERVTVPPHYAAEMIPYDPAVGEFRVHYAGFFDPGFGYGGNGGGTPAVLEVRSHEVPFLIEDGQIVGRLVYERLTGVPERTYGAAIGSSYGAQGLTLAKQFRK